jgi:hypothetical protein
VNEKQRGHNARLSANGTARTSWEWLEAHAWRGRPQTAEHLAGGDASFTAYAGLIALFANNIVAGVVRLAMIQQRPTMKS